MVSGTDVSTLFAIHVPNWDRHTQVVRTASALTTRLVDRVTCFVCGCYLRFLTTIRTCYHCFSDTNVNRFPCLTRYGVSTFTYVGAFMFTYTTVGSEGFCMR